MAAKKKNVTDLVAENIGATNDALTNQVAGSKERQTENDILCKQIELEMKLQQQKFDQDLAKVKALEESALSIRKQELDEEREKREKVQSWTKIGIRVLEGAAFVGVGLLKLKENLLIGKEQGSDAEPWWRELRKKD